MRVLVCGGRAFGDLASERARLYHALDAIHADVAISELIEGGAFGADFYAARWARKKRIPIKTFEAEWGKYGRAAGPRRNQKMLEDGKPDLVIAFPGGDGTRDMVERATTYGVRVFKALN